MAHAAEILYVLAGCLIFSASVGLLYCALVAVFTYVHYQRGLGLMESLRRALEELQ